PRSSRIRCQGTATATRCIACASTTRYAITSWTFCSAGRQRLATPSRMGRGSDAPPRRENYEPRQRSEYGDDTCRTDGEDPRHQAGEGPDLESHHRRDRRLFAALHHVRAARPDEVAEAAGYRGREAIRPFAGGRAAAERGADARRDRSDPPRSDAVSLLRGDARFRSRAERAHPRGVR